MKMWTEKSHCQALSVIMLSFGTVDLNLEKKKYCSISLPVHCKGFQMLSSIYQDRIFKLFEYSRANTMTSKTEAIKLMYLQCDII